MAVTWKKLAYDADKINHSLATAANDFLVASGSGVFVKKTLAETQTILGIDNGWIPFLSTWTYASADAPTFTFTISGDQTGLLSPGMRLKLTQITIKYFIITAISYSSPNTTVTVYGGTDYTLANAAITNPFFSSVKAPHGFPLDPTKWTVEVNNATLLEEVSPVEDTWHNIGSISISIPIGVWVVFYEVCAGFYADPDISDCGGFTTLSTANNSESDIDLTCFIYGYMSILPSGSQLWAQQTLRRRKTIALASKTSYYLNHKIYSADINLIQIIGVASPTILRAVCAYL